MRSLVRLIDTELQVALAQYTDSPCPAKLREAIQYAVFPGGARIRPQLCLSVAKAAGDPYPELSRAAAVAIELYHCASLAQDDLPCFDGATTRRGRPALHCVFGESYAVLVGDALIIAASGVLAGVNTCEAERRVAILRRLLRAAGPQDGLVAGQAWESEPSVDRTRYHACKTVSLFESAAACGALASGAEEQPWCEVGRRFGAAFQIADDIADTYGDAIHLGKPVAQDRARRRPNIVFDIGRDQALEELRRLLGEAVGLVPDCLGGAKFCEWLAGANARILESAAGSAGGVFRLPVHVAQRVEVRR